MQITHPEQLPEYFIHCANTRRTDNGNVFPAFSNSFLFPTVSPATRLPIVTIVKVGASTPRFTPAIGGTKERKACIKQKETARFSRSVYISMAQRFMRTELSVEVG